MKNFAAAAALAVTASAVNKGTLEMRIDNWEYDVQSIPQGKGKHRSLLFLKRLFVDTRSGPHSLELGRDGP